MNNLLSEKVIEDILSTDKSILSELLSVNSSDLSMIARQKIISSGKLDLLCLCKDEILLIELKVIPFYREIIKQVSDYKIDLLGLQNQNKLIKSKIKKVVLVTDCSESDIVTCKENNIELIVYQPEAVLSKYYENFKELSSFLKIQPGDFGVVRIGLLKNTLAHLDQGKNLNDICKLENKSKKTIKNKMSVAQYLNLVSKFKNSYFLTDIGKSFVELGQNIVDDRLSQAQVELLSDSINENPFYSPITYTIYSIIESVFVLAKASYPVPKESLKDYFIKSVGKLATWRMPRARETATYIFSNYACELEFLSRVNNEFYITPKGIRAVLLLQLNRSIKLIESIK